MRFGPSTSVTRFVQSLQQRMKLSSKLSIFLIVCVAIGAGIFATRNPGTARVDWENKTLEFHPVLTEKTIVAEFKFTNAGNRPIQILDVKSGCGCTTAIPDKTDYQPGEQGRITATFTLGERTGLQKIPITVKLSGDGEPAKLLLIAHLPIFMTVTPELLSWQIGEAPEPKAATLHVEPGVQLQITKVESIDPAFSASLETIEEGKDYRVVVKPETTSRELMAAVTIDALIAGEVQKSFTVFPNIKPANKQ